ncbi:MAG: hypothetical protein ABI868_19325 [Acidobacteriota bacterium]
MNRLKLGAGLVAALLIALAAAWLWGSSGKGDLQEALAVAELRSDLLTARSALLSARVDLYLVNFGDASRDFELARTALRRADARLKTIGRDEQVMRLAIALARLDEAQQFAGQLDQTANARAADAIKPIDETLGSFAAP